MISRLVLVGMVAALGLSIPSWSEFERGFSSFRSWTTAQLAEWDTWQPREDDSITVPEMPSPPRLEIRRVVTSPVVTGEQQPAPRSRLESSERAVEGPSDCRIVATVSSLVERQPSRTAIAFVPITVENDLTPDVADEFNRMCEGLEIRPTMPVETETSTHEVSLGSRNPVTTDDLTSVASSISVELRLALRLCRFTETSRVDQTLPNSSDVNQETLQASNSVDDIFDENPAGYEPAEEGLASDVRQQPITMAVKPTFELIEPSDEVTDQIARELNRLTDGITITPEVRATHPARRPSFEPIVLAENLDSGVAYELNRASEGFGIVLPKTGRASQRESARTTHSESQPVPDTGDGNLRRAVRMTRDAARAWMDVLTGPPSDQMAFR
jgi:hypothetical protein